MAAKDWALVAFTLLSQMGVGVFLVVWLVHLLARRQANEAEVRKLCSGALVGAGPIIVIGLLASTLHLGSPLNAWLALSNFATSWLSREIFFTLAFFVMWCVCAYLEWRGLGTEAGRRVWAGLTALAGLLLVFSTSMAYYLPTRPAWASPSTPILFFSSMLVLGGLAAAVIFAVYYLRAGKESETQTALVKLALSTAAVVTMVVIVIQVLALLIQAGYLAGGTAEAQAAGALLFGTNAVWFWLRVLIGIVAGFVAVALIWRALASAKGVPAVVTNLVFLAFVLVVIGEILGRMLFYLAVVPVSPVG